LNSVDFPTFGRPTIATIFAMFYYILMLCSVCKNTQHKNKKAILFISPGQASTFIYYFITVEIQE